MAIKTRHIAVIGGAECTPQEVKIAEEVGREIARSGAILICGGLGGVMAAACKGAVSAGGTTVGILPGASRDTANPYVTIPVVTDMGEARNVIVVKSADAVIAVGGAYGTLSEIALALRDGTPVIGLDTWSLSRSGKADTGIISARTPQDAVRLALGMSD